MTYTGVRFLSGTGSPEGVITAPYGTEFYQTDASAGSEVWDKTTGFGNTGWRLRGNGGAYLDSSGLLQISSGPPTNLDTTENVATALKALTGMADGIKRIVMGYYAANDGGGGTFRFNASSGATDNGGTIIAPTTGTGRWERIFDGFTYNVKQFGAKGIGSSGATQDQAAFSAAFSAAGSDGVAYGPAGNYYVTGGFTLGLYGRFICAGSGNVTINHTGNNSFLSTLTETSGDQFRAYKGFRLLGNSGTSAKGIVHGNSYGPDFDDVVIENYPAQASGAGGVGLELGSTTTYTEGAKLRGIEIRNCNRCLATTKSGAGTGSLSNMSMENVLLVVDAANAYGWWMDDGTSPYFSKIHLKIHMENATGTGWRIGQDCLISQNNYNVGFEMWFPAAKGIVTTSKTGVEITGRGTIWPHPGAVHGSGNNVHAIDPTTKISIQSTPDIVNAFGPGSDEYRYICKLPISSSTTRDKVLIDFTGGPEWYSSGLTHDRVLMGARNGFWFQYQRWGQDPNASRSNMRIVVYQQGDGSYDVYLRSVASFFSTAMVEAFGVGLGGSAVTTGEQVESIALKPPSTTTPSGTLWWDSYTATPNADLSIGYLTANGLLQAQTGALTYNAGVSYPLATQANGNITPVTVNANSTAAQNLMSYTVPAGVLNSLLRSLRVRGAGVWSTVNTSQVPTVTIALTLGGVAIASWVTAAVTTGGQPNVPWAFEVLLITSATGASGTVETHGDMRTRLAAAAGPANIYLDSNVAVSGAINLTAAATLQVTVQFSTNNATANTATQRQMIALLSG